MTQRFVVADEAAIVNSPRSAEAAGCIDSLLEAYT
jgi:hypothetical protein